MGPDSEPEKRRFDSFDSDLSKTKASRNSQLTELVLELFPTGTVIHLEYLANREAVITGHFIFYNELSKEEELKIFLTYEDPKGKLCDTSLTAGELKSKNIIEDHKLDIDTIFKRKQLHEKAFALIQDIRTEGIHIKRLNGPPNRAQRDKFKNALDQEFEGSNYNYKDEVLKEFIKEHFLKQEVTTDTKRNKPLPKLELKLKSQETEQALDFNPPNRVLKIGNNEVVSNAYVKNELMKAYGINENKDKNFVKRFINSKRIKAIEIEATMFDERPYQTNVYLKKDIDIAITQLKAELKKTPMVNDDGIVTIDVDGIKTDVSHHGYFADKWGIDAVNLKSILTMLEIKPIEGLQLRSKSNKLLKGPYLCSELEKLRTIVECNEGTPLTFQNGSVEICQSLEKFASINNISDGALKKKINSLGLTPVALVDLQDREKTEYKNRNSSFKADIIYILEENSGFLDVSRGFVCCISNNRDTPRHLYKKSDLERALDDQE